MRGKGKEPAGSSSASEHDAAKRRRLGGQADPNPEIVYVKPPWNGGPLSALPEEYQAEYFIEKMNKLQNKREGFICEKEVPEDQFGPFGVYEKFRALGWEAALKCYDGGKKVLYMDEIEEWVSTLELTVGRSPSHTKLVGSVNGVKVTMSFESLNQVAKFDSKPSNRYQYPHLDDLYLRPERNPNWLEMLNDLFLPNKNAEKNLRDDLKLKAKLLHLIMQHNVTPRRGDKSEVRFSEIPILYALMHGEPMVSFRYLVMYNIWLSRDSHERKIVPHCRLITALLKRKGVITSDSVGHAKRFLSFDLKTLGANWVFGESDTRYVLTNAKRDRKWTVLKAGGNDDSGDEIGSEDDSEDENEEDNESENEEMEEGAGTDIPGTSGVNIDNPPQRRGSARSYYQYDRRPLDSNWAHGGSMEEVIRRARPNIYDAWMGPTQVTYDHITRVGASQERAMKQMYDRQEEWNQAHAYAQQREINHRYEDDRQLRMHNQWHAGQEVIPDPPTVDYTTLPPYDGSVNYPVPPIHHSEWIDPRQDQPSQQPTQQEAQEGSFGFGAFQDTFTQIFGPPQPRYY